MCICFCSSGNIHLLKMDALFLCQLLFGWWWSGCLLHVITAGHLLWLRILRFTWLLLEWLIRESKCFELLWINSDLWRVIRVEIFLLSHFYGLFGDWWALCEPFESLNFPNWVHTLQVHLLNSDLAWTFGIWIRINVLIEGRCKLVDV